MNQKFHAGSALWLSVMISLVGYSQEKNDQSTLNPRIMTDTLTMELTRVFDAPLEKVWNAWKEPEQVKKWWGPNGFTCPAAKMDFQEGGVSLVCMRSPDGFEIFNTWTYQKILPMKRLEYVLHFSDKDGNKLYPAAIGMPPGIPRDVPHVITFKDVENGRTEVTVTEYGYTTKEIVEMSKAGMSECLSKMEESFKK
jgi:uncharacterized protein YndB with AHSA1/START domain